MIVWMGCEAVYTGQARWKTLIYCSDKQDARKGNMIQHSGHYEEADEATADDDGSRNAKYHLYHNECRVQDTRGLLRHDYLDAKCPQQVGKQHQWWPPAQEEPGGMRLRCFGGHVEWHFNTEQAQDDHTE